MWNYPCEDEACADYERVHRPYAKARGKNWRPSASDLADISFGGFDGAARKAAMIGVEYALSHGRRQLDEGVPYEDVYATATVVHAARWNTDKNLGTAAHQAIDAAHTGSYWEPPTDLYAGDEVLLAGYINAGCAWIERRQPDVLASELIVSRDDPRYVATLDQVAELDGYDRPVLVDFKTRREFKDDLSHKFDAWHKQLTLIGLSTHIEHWHAGEYVDKIPWLSSGLPRPEVGLIVVLDADGSFREYECPIDPADLELVEALVRVRRWKPRLVQVASNVVRFPARPDAPVDVEAMLG